jgi:hypothetical protein
MMWRMQVRSDTRNALGLGGKLVYVIFAHPLDGPDSTTHAVWMSRMFAAH